MTASDTKVPTSGPISILKAKLNRPGVTRKLLVRPRLLDLLNRGLHRPLTVVSAPAGFGKTTLISSWLDGMAAVREVDPAPPPAVWLSLDAHDSDLVIFLSYLIAALRQCFPGAGSETLALLRAPQQPPTAMLFTTLNNEIEALSEGLVLVLDDYHLLGGQDVHDFLASLVRHWPRPLQLVLISRVDPPLPLASLRAGGKVTVIRTADLRLNAEETAAYLDQALEMPLGPEDRALLERRTGGWIAALRLATTSLRSSIDVEGVPRILARSGTSISSYLQDEILEQQVPAIQTFLLQTSILDRFCPSLCEAVVGQSDPAWSVRACIDWLERADLLVPYQGERRTWYRYHALLRAFLRDRLLVKVGAEVVAGLQREAAIWFAQEGMPHEAVRHALESRDLDLAASLIEDRLCDELNREDQAILGHWLALLPEELVQRRPRLLMMKAWSLQLSWQLSAQAKLVSQVEALIGEDGGATLSPQEQRLLRGQVLAFQGQYAWLNNQATRCVACCEETLVLLPREWVYVRGAANAYWALAMGAMGQDQAAERALLDEYPSLEDKTAGYALRILHALCLNHLNAGQLESARQTAQVMLKQAIRGGLDVMQCWARLTLGVVHYQWNDLDGAGAHFAEVVGRRYLCQSLTAYQAMAGLALVHLARGEPSEARRLADLLSSFQLEQRGYEADDARSLRARLMLDQGDREGAFRWADAFTAPVLDRPLFWVEVAHITRAEVLLARGTADDLSLALRILDELLEIAGRTHNARSKITILALRALALDAQGQTEGAFLALQEAVDLSRPGGFLRVFVDLGPPMEGLLGRLAGHGSTAEYIHRIFAAFPGPPPGPVAGDTPAVTGSTQPPPKQGDGSAFSIPGLIEPLTRRELEILMLLREPMSPKEIACQLDISYLTVKRHSINLYGKLGVNARWDAVTRATELGILPPS